MFFHSILLCHSPNHSCLILTSFLWFSSFTSTALMIREENEKGLLDTYLTSLGHISHCDGNLCITSLTRKLAQLLWLFISKNNYWLMIKGDYALKIYEFIVFSDHGENNLLSLPGKFNRFLDKKNASFHKSTSTVYMI